MEILENFWSFMITPNENLTNIVTCSPLTILDVYISMLLFTTILNINSTTRNKVLFVCINSVISIFSRIILPNPYGTFINIFSLILTIKLIFKTSFIKSIVASIIPLIITLLLESVFLRLCQNLFHISYEEITYTAIYRLPIMFSVYLSEYLICIVAKYLKIKINVFDNMDKSSKLLLLLNLIFAIILICTQLYLIEFYNDNLPALIILLSIGSIIAYFVLSVYSLIRTTQLEITSKNLEESKLYNKTLTILHDNIRCFKHDFSNIVQSIGGYVQTDDMIGLKKYYSQLLEDCQKLNNLTVLNPELINNPAIYSLLTSKYHDADSKGIKFNIEIFMDLNSINMKIYEFTRILGILLDNAIEASNDCNDKVINFYARIDKNNNRQLIILENTYSQKDIDTEKIFDKAYSTKENNTGIGLWEVRKILNKNNNINLFTSKDNTYFKQQLEIYLQTK